MRGGGGHLHAVYGALAAVSVPAEEEKMHSNAQGDHEVRALQQPPNAAHAERAISKQAPPSLYGVPAYSTRVGAAPRTLGGARHGWQQGRDQPTAHRTVNVMWRHEIRVRAAGGRDRSGCTKGAPRSANRQGEQPGVPIAVDIWGVDGGFAMDLNILTMDLRWICLFDTYPCPALLPFLHGVKLVPRTFCTL